MNWNQDYTLEFVEFYDKANFITVHELPMSKENDKICIKLAIWRWIDDQPIINKEIYLIDEKFDKGMTEVVYGENIG